MDYQMVLSSLQGKVSELDSLSSKASTFASNCKSELSSMSGKTDISSLYSKLTKSTDRLEKAYKNCSTWFNDYIGELQSLESSLASFNSSNISAPQEFSWKFEDLFGRVLMPTLKTGGDKNANLEYGKIASGTDEQTAENQASGETVASQEFQNYYQGDYSNVSYGYGKSIADAGCGPTSLAMVLQYRTGKKIDPTVTAKYAMQHKYRLKGNGTDEKLFPAMAAEYGIECSKQSQTASNIRKALQSGKVCIMHMKEGHFTGGGHYMVLKGITSDGKAIVADPASRSRSNKTWSIDLIARETKGSMYVF